MRLTLLIFSLLLGSFAHAGAYQVPATRITGLSNSGTTDNLGTWNEDVDLDSFVTVPAGVTAVILMVANDASSPRWQGVRTPGKTASPYFVDAIIDSQRYSIVPLGAGNTIDLYAEAATTTFFVILGFMSADWTFFDIDATLPQLPSTTGTQTVSGPSEVPAGATLLMLGFIYDWMPVGESVLLDASDTNALSPQLIKLDGSKQVQLNAAAASNIYGYTTTGVTWTTWLSSAESITADGTAYTGTSSNAAAEFAFISWSGWSTGQGFATRAQGDSVVPMVSVNSPGNGHFPQLNVSGQYQYQAETGFTGTVYVVAWLTEPAASSGGLLLRRRRS